MELFKGRSLLHTHWEYHVSLLSFRFHQRSILSLAFEIVKNKYPHHPQNSSMIWEGKKSTHFSQLFIIVCIHRLLNVWFIFRSMTKKKPKNKCNQMYIKCLLLPFNAYMFIDIWVDYCHKNKCQCLLWMLCDQTNICSVSTYKRLHFRNLYIPSDTLCKTFFKYMFNVHLTYMY